MIFKARPSDPFPSRTTDDSEGERQKYAPRHPDHRDRLWKPPLTGLGKPIFEADFKPCSYGFRPMRRAQDAIAQIHHSRPAPMSGCWRVHHGVLRRDRPHGPHGPGATSDRDKRVLELVKAFLRSGLLTEGGQIIGPRPYSPGRHPDSSNAMDTPVPKGAVNRDRVSDDDTLGSDQDFP